MNSIEQIVVEQQFSDLDQFADYVDTWDIEFLQLEKGEIEIDFAHLTRPNLLIGYCSLSRKVDQQGSAPEGYWTFAFARAPKIIWRNIDVGDDQVIVYSPGSEIECISWPGFEVLTLSLHKDLLHQVCERYRFGRLQDLLSQKEVIATDPVATHRFKKRLKEILRSSLGKAKPGNNLWLDQYVEYELAEDLCALLRSGYANVAYTSTPTRRRAIRQVREYLEESKTWRFSVSELCDITGLSERTLQYAFQEHLGVSPKSYINLTRLRKVHQALRESSAETTSVSFLASNWGFWHMGQFASDYKKVFGCIPSETLKKDPA